MTIDNEAASLLAQVIPALLVFLALEDRLIPTKVPNPAARKPLSKLREIAVAMNIFALGACLLIVVTNVEETPLALALDPYIAVSVIALLGVLTMLLIAMFAAEDVALEDASQT